MRRTVVAAALWAGAVASGCGRAAPEPAGPARFVRDGRGKLVHVPEPLRRIVSIAPSATELLFAAGAGDLLVGATRYCDWPPEARALPRVGDIVIDYERLEALRPDLVVTAYSITRGTTAELEAKGYAVFAVDPGTFEEIGEALRALGGLAGRGEAGRRAAEALEARVRAVRPADPPGPTFYFEHSSDPLGGAGPETYVGDALRRAGGRNVLEGGWRPVDWEVILARDPEVILVAHDRREGLERRAGWGRLRAVRDGRVYFVPKERFVYPTPRLAEGLEEAARIFRGEKTP